ncbi:MAG: DUF169 domain-containing protein [Mailhella sp.]|nr:DUF169 domain-containing protein [Mailhella sp.]
MTLSFPEIHQFLINELRLVHNPVGYHFCFSQEELESFRQSEKFITPVKPLTLCQAELGARMEGKTVLLEMDKLWCPNAKISYRIKEPSDRDVKEHLKFCTSEEEAKRFLLSKPRLEQAPLAVILRPLFEQKKTPDIIHFCCDNMQAYHLLNDWMAVTGTHPFHPNICVNSSVCGGSAYCYTHQTANLNLACGGSYNSGKMERGEINVMIPGKDFLPMMQRMAERKEKTGGISLTRSGQPFPGAHICKNCPLIAFH